MNLYEEKINQVENSERQLNEEKRYLHKLKPFIHSLEWFLDTLEYGSLFHLLILHPNSPVKLSMYFRRRSEEYLMQNLVKPTKEFLEEEGFETKDVVRSLDGSSVNYVLEGVKPNLCKFTLEVHSTDSPDCELETYKETITKYRLKCKE